MYANKGNMDVYIKWFNHTLILFVHPNSCTKLRCLSFDQCLSLQFCPRSWEDPAGSP